MRRALFGIPNRLLLVLARRIWPFEVRGTFSFQTEAGETMIEFNARNTQYRALYDAHYAAGYEPELTALLDLLLAADGSFYDVGSNWGFFALYVASRPGFRGKIHAFEPFPATFADLTDTVKQSGLSDRIQCHPVALTDHEGLVAMRLPDGTQSGLAVVDESARGSIRATSLDALSLEPPALIKIDAEGSEGAILSGGLNLLRREQPFVVFENWRSLTDLDQTLKPLQILQQVGYVFFHPCWLRQYAGQDYFFPPESDLGSKVDETLALVPLSLQDRYLRLDQINILAVPPARLNQVTGLFENYDGTLSARGALHRT